MYRPTSGPIGQSLEENFQRQLVSGCGNDAIFGVKIMRAFREMRYQSKNFLRKRLKSFKQLRNIANIKKISSLCSRKNY